MPQIRPDELIRMLQGRLQTRLRGYSEGGEFAAGQTMTGYDSIAMGDGAVVSVSSSVVGGGDNNEITGGGFGTIGGGFTNKVTAGSGSTISGGDRNEISEHYCAIGGGQLNNIAENYATIGGGRSNDISGPAGHGTIGGGGENVITSTVFSDAHNVIGGGGKNTITTCKSATISGGYNNDIAASADYSAIGGGEENQIVAGATHATIGGGRNNNIDVNADYSVIGGGQDNDIGNVGPAIHNVIGGGYNNHLADVTGSVIGGGANHISSASYAVIGGGLNNDITSGGADYGAIVGGQDNTIIAGLKWNFIGGGYSNLIDRNLAGADPNSSSILGGRNNEIVSSYSVIGGGYNNDIVGNADYGVIGGGDYNQITNTLDGHVIGGGRNNLISPGIYGVGRTTISGGQDNEAQGGMSAIPGGYRAKTDKYCQVASASGRFAARGDAQGTIQMVVRRYYAAHAVNFWLDLWLDGGVVPIHIAASTAWTIHCLVVGITQNAAQQWSYELIGLIERDNANNTTLAGQTKRVIFESDANYDAQLAADDANETLVVQVRRTGGVDYAVRWVATVRLAEVTYP